MRITLRTALICMLMLALPAQSMAALGMQLCAVTQQSKAQNGVMSQADSLMTAHHPGAMAMAQPAATQHGSHHRAADAGKAASVADNSLCSLCAFCVGAVALSTVVASNSPLQAVEPSLARLDQFVGFIAETPERPPRFFLA
ncbi:MAG: hypothetical protein KJ884_16560 [Gammaproteobacteria bacterium]|nr:hypothetical protein [Gammaproteobacteria bacterium]MBU1492034.1 hypothetical protein [Gammaproteobacteria bacterium]MBU2065940.1 hypothetical protein [Gammaproteobacteria bacterium]MBU2141266.1 hypothetical protein [Gammaproteobacteria bacterium]MBU2215366.1 hypothetical protein [Gammaproteobacteria bacterium]